MGELLNRDALLGLAVTLCFAGAAWACRGVTHSGAVVGAVLGFSVYIGSGFGGLSVMVVVFVLTWASTRLGYSRKQRLGMAESRRGRSGAQVAANIGTAAIFSVIAAATHREAFLAGAMAALAEAAGDTVSSECGEALSSRAYLITTLRPSPVGTDGAISLLGTVAAVLACLVVSTAAVAARVLAIHDIGIVAGSAFAGTLMDSLLGATFERRHMIGNNSVNFISTTSAGLLALALFSIHS